MNKRQIIVLLLAALLASACATSTSGGLSPTTAEPTPTPSTVLETPRPTAEPTTDTGLTSSEEAHIARFDAGAATSLVRPFAERAPVPADAIPAFSIDSYFETGETATLNAAAEAARTENQVVVTADVSGCVLMTAWALPQPDEVVIGYEWADVDCAVAVDFHLTFLIDKVGTNTAGDFDYRANAPATRLEVQVA